MIISKTPLRMSFVGGGSDLPSFYQRHGGAVLSTAINKYVFVTCNPKFDDGIRIAYSKNEEVDCVDAIEHRIVRAAMNFLRIPGGIEITTIADVPSKGTGLGSSSSFTVGLLNVLHAFQGRYVSMQQLAEESCHIEINICSEPIGKQDQYAAAAGGFNLLEFRQNGRVDVTPVIIPPAQRDKMARRIVAFYTGVTRSASALLKVQSDAVSRDRGKQDALIQMVELTYRLKSELEAGHIDSLGEILHENWELKKSLAAGISTPEIDAWYEQAMQLGATGGKLLGAGAGGFLIFYADEEFHDRIAAGLGLRRVRFDFESMGSQVIFYNPPS